MFQRSAPQPRINEAAEGETVPTIVVVRRVDISTIEVEVVRIGSGRVCTRRPAVAVDASVPQDSEININVPAAHQPRMP